jgi:hypothetical protein
LTNWSVYYLTLDIHVKSPHGLYRSDLGVSIIESANLMAARGEVRPAQAVAENFPRHVSTLTDSLMPYPQPITTRNHTMALASSRRTVGV